VATDLQPSVPVGISSAWTHATDQAAGAGFQPFLRTRVADAASLALFSGGALAASESLLFMAPETLTALAVGLTLLGPLGCGIEWGVSGRPSWLGAVGVGAFAAAFHLAALWILRGEPSGVLLRGLPILILGTLVARFGSRFDRGEEEWRAAVRGGPAHGFSHLADRIASVRLPVALRWILLPLLPVTLVLRGLCLAGILSYQLTLSRLMPSACRYEPTCSRYGFQAYAQHGCTGGSLLTAFRLARCSPFGSGGLDPVPKAGPLLPWTKP
jgi:putative membrane protein insertion efficiency factor